MITGYDAATGQVIADSVGVADVRAELLPGDKLTAIAAVCSAGHRGGDGRRRRQRRARARRGRVGLAVGTGTVVARETADVVLITVDLSELAQTLRIAGRAGGVVLQTSSEPSPSTWRA